MIDDESVSYEEGAEVRPPVRPERLPARAVKSEPQAEEQSPRTVTGAGATKRDVKEERAGG